MRILLDHTEPPEAYHQWVFVGDLVQLDTNGVAYHSRTRQHYGETWVKVVCNNPSCAGTGFVNPARVLAFAFERGLRP